MELVCYHGTDAKLCTLLPFCKFNLFFFIKIPTKFDDFIYRFVEHRQQLLLKAKEEEFG